jgi:hypothetical protein
VKGYTDQFLNKKVVTFYGVSCLNLSALFKNTRLFGETIRDGSGLILLGSGRARAFSGLKKLLNKSGLIRARARALLFK